MKDQQVNPVMAAVVAVVVLLLAGGIWYFNANRSGGAGPAAGQAGRADPTLSGPNSIMSRAPQRGGTAGGRPLGPGAANPTNSR
jgi:hypothetical protein